MNYKVGDIVKVRSDLNTIKGVISEMLEFRGKIVHIEEAFEKDYFIYEDPEKWYWTDEMLEPFTKEDIKEYLEECVKDFKDYDVKFEVKKKEPILDEEEKKYLSAVIKPFRDRVRYIEKRSEGDQYILISLRRDEKPYCENLLLPDFKADTMYNGMMLCKQYSLEELDIQYN